MVEYVQHCFGEYEKQFCNGNARSDDIYDSLPCNRRDICEAFQLYLEEIGKNRVDYFAIERGEGENGEEFFYAALENEKDFLAFCVKLVDRYGTHAKRIKKKRYKVVEKPKKKKRITKTQKKKRAIRCKKLVSERVKFVNQVLDGFRIELSAKLPLGCAVVEDGVFPLPGQLFIVNRTTLLRRGPIYLFMKGYASNDTGIVRLVPLYGQWKFLAIFMFQKERVEECLGEELAEFLELESIGEYCGTKRLDKIGVSLLAEAVALFFEKGFIVASKRGAEK